MDDDTRIDALIEELRGFTTPEVRDARVMALVAELERHPAAEERCRQCAASDVRS